MLGDGRPGRDIEEYTSATRSEYHVEPREVILDQIGPVVFSFVLTALDVVVAKKNNPQAAYRWIEQHTRG